MREQPARKRALGARLLLALASVVGALLVVEAALRLLGLPVPATNVTPVTGMAERSPDRKVRFRLKANAEFFHAFPDDPRGYFGPEGGVRYRTNSLGVRGDELEPAPGPDDVRIVVLGDSFTFGTGVRLEDTFCEELERRLNEDRAPRRHEVINLGVPAYDTEQEVALLEHLGLDLAPDLVIICFFLNDARPNRRPRERQQPGVQRGPRGRGEPPDAHGEDLEDERSLLTRVSRIVQMIRAAREREASTRRYIESLRASFGESSPGWRKIRGALARAGELGESHGFRLALVIFPVLDWLDDSYPLHEIHDKVARVAESEGIPVLDLFPTFRGRDGPSLWVHASNQHPNEIGHALAGAAIHAFLAEGGLLED